MKKLILLLIFISITLAFNVEAIEIVKDKAIDSNNLYITHINANNVDIEVNDNNIKVLDVPSATPEQCDQFLNSDPWWGSNMNEIHCRWFGYDNESLKSNSKNIYVPNESRKNAIIKITYDKVGTYLGKDVGATLIISEIPETTTNDSFGIQTIFQVSKSLYDGLKYLAAQGHKQTYQFFYSDSKQQINLDNSYITLNSNNFVQYNRIANECDQTSECDESIYFNSEQLSNLEQVIVKNNTNMVESTNLKNKYLFGMSPISNEFTDRQGAEDFEKNSFTIKVKNNLSFYVDSSRTGRTNYVWMTISTAPINGVITPPKKYIIDKYQKRVTEAEYKIGEEFTYEVEQKINTLGVDILTQYSKFNIIDVLPKEVAYIDAKLVDDNGKEVTVGDGKIVYDNGTHQVTYTANKPSEIPLNGQTYTLKIKVKALKSQSNKFTNSAVTLINDKKLETNIVTITVPKEDLKVIVPDTLKKALALSIGILLMILAGVIYYLNKKVRNN